MKKWIAEALALLLSVGSQSALYGAAAPPLQTGQELVQHVETRYKKGEFGTFLSSMDEQYRSAGNVGAVRGIFQGIKSAMGTESSPNMEKLRAKIKKLDQERNQKLLDAIAEDPELPIAKKVDSIAFSSQSEENSKILSEFEALKFRVPESVAATADNRIWALETEYYIKNLLLVAANHLNKTDTDQTEKQIALALEKFEKMQTVAKENRDKNWQQKIKKAKSAYLADRAYRMDIEALTNYANETINEKNSVEQKIKQIMMEYQQQVQQISAK